MSTRHYPGLACRISGCGDAVRAKKARLCITHYHRLRSTGREDIEHIEKQCEVCAVTMKLSGGSRMRQRFCSARCRGSFNRKLEAQKPDAREKQIAYKYSWKIKQYGLTVAEYEAIYQQQHGCCGICGLHASELSKGGLGIDHDHSTGIVRGLLCRRCNAAIGGLGDSLELLHKAISYLSGDHELSVTE